VSKWCIRAELVAISHFTQISQTQNHELAWFWCTRDDISTKNLQKLTRCTAPISSK